MYVKKEVCQPNMYFFAFLCCWIYHYGLSKHRFFVCNGQLIKILGSIFSGDHPEFFDAGILGCNTGRHDISRNFEGKLIKPIF